MNKSELVVAFFCGILFIIITICLIFSLFEKEEDSSLSEIMEEGFSYRADINGQIGADEVEVVIYYLNGSNYTYKTNISESLVLNKTEAS